MFEAPLIVFTNLILNVIIITNTFNFLNNRHIIWNILFMAPRLCYFVRNLFTFYKNMLQISTFLTNISIVIITKAITITNPENHTVEKKHDFTANKSEELSS